MPTIFLRKNSYLSFFSAVAILTVLIGLSLPRTAAALSPAEAYLINQGFQVFNTQTFGGNGRTCSTCHLPQKCFTMVKSTFGKWQWSTSGRCRQRSEFSKTWKP